MEASASTFAFYLEEKDIDLKLRVRAFETTDLNFTWNVLLKHYLQKICDLFKKKVESKGNIVY